MSLADAVSALYKEGYKSVSASVAGGASGSLSLFASFADKKLPPEGAVVLSFGASEFLELLGAELRLAGRQFDALEASHYVARSFEIPSKPVFAGLVARSQGTVSRLNPNDIRGLLVSARNPALKALGDHFDKIECCFVKGAGGDWSADRFEVHVKRSYAAPVCLKVENRLAELYRGTEKLASEEVSDFDVLARVFADAEPGSCLAALAQAYAQSQPKLASAKASKPR